MSNTMIPSFPLATMFSMPPVIPTTNTTTVPDPTRSSSTRRNISAFHPPPNSVQTDTYASNDEEYEDDADDANHPTHPSENDDDVPFAKRKKRNWSAAEDELLRRLVHELGEGQWAKIAGKFAGRVGKQCRDRWCNHLAPTLDRNKWCEEDDVKLLEAVKTHGKLWAEIARKIFPGRSDLSIKNRYYSSQRRIERRNKETRYPSPFLAAGVTGDNSAAGPGDDDDAYTTKKRKRNVTASTTKRSRKNSTLTQTVPSPPPPMSVAPPPPLHSRGPLYFPPLLPPPSSYLGPPNPYWNIPHIGNNGAAPPPSSMVPATTTSSTPTLQHQQQNSQPHGMTNGMQYFQTLMLSPLTSLAASPVPSPARSPVFGASSSMPQQHEHPHMYPGIFNLNNNPTDGGNMMQQQQQQQQQQYFYQLASQQQLQQQQQMAAANNDLSAPGTNTASRNLSATQYFTAPTAFQAIYPSSAPLYTTNNGVNTDVQDGSTKSATGMGPSMLSQQQQPQYFPGDQYHRRMLDENIWFSGIGLPLASPPPTSHSLVGGTAPTGRLFSEHSSPTQQNDGSVATNDGQGSKSPFEVVNDNKSLDHSTKIGHHDSAAIQNLLSLSSSRPHSPSSNHSSQSVHDSVQHAGHDDVASSSSPPRVQVHGSLQFSMV